MSFRNNPNGFGGVMIYKSTADIDLVLSSPTTFFNGDDCVWSRYWVGSNPKNSFVEYNRESVFVNQNRTIIDTVEQSIEVYGFDTIDNNFSTQKKLQNMISWAIQESRKKDGGYLIVCPRYDFNNKQEPDEESFYHNTFFNCNISKQYYAEDVGNSGGAEDFKLNFNVIERKTSIDVPEPTTLFNLVITSGGTTYNCTMKSNSTDYNTVINIAE